MEKGYETRGVFLDISKSFDEVWDEDLFFVKAKFTVYSKTCSIINKKRKLFFMISYLIEKTFKQLFPKVTSQQYCCY